MTAQAQLLTIILPTESLESAAAHEKPESLTHQEYCVLSGFYPHQGATGTAPTFYREATLRGIIEPSEAATRYLDALRERGIIFGWRIDAVATAEGDEPPAILPEDIIKAGLEGEFPGSAKAELAFDPDCFAYAEEPHEIAKSVGFLWEAYAQQIIDHIVKRGRSEERARLSREDTALPSSAIRSNGHSE
jgi:hypothetical protein